MIIMQSYEKLTEKIKKGRKLLFIDVRSPSEYREARIPGAINIPIFSDKEREYIGTLYKVEGKRTAIREAVGIVGKKIQDIYIEFEKHFSLLYAEYLLPKYDSIIKLRDMLLLTLVIQDDIELSRLKEEVRKEVAIFVDYHKKISQVKIFEEYKEVADDFMSKSKLTEKCDELRTYLTKYITETTFRLVSPERMAEKILKQTKGDLNIRFKVVRKENMKGGN